jgi:hypothetical protein
MAIKLGLPKKPYWIDLPQGVRVFVRPLTTAIYETAWASSQGWMRRLFDAKGDIEETGAVIEGLPDLTTEAGRQGYNNFLFAQALARDGILKWEGVLEDVVDDDGKPVLDENDKPLTKSARLSPETIDDLMTWHAQAETFVKAYTQPFTDRIVEGNASGRSPSGTSVEGPKPAAAVH